MTGARTGGGSRGIVFAFLLGAAAVVLAAAVAAVLGLSLSAETARHLTAATAQAGRTEVLPGRFTRYEIVSGLPVNTSFYALEIPSSAPVPQAGTTIEVKGPEDWGFPPSTTFPATRDYLVFYRAGALVFVSQGPTGSLRPTTAADVERLHAQLVAGRILSVMGVGGAVLAAGALARGAFVVHRDGAAPVSSSPAGGSAPPAR